MLASLAVELLLKQETGHQNLISVWLYKHKTEFYGTHYTFLKIVNGILYHPLQPMLK